MLGFLPQYLSVEGYAEGHRFLLLGLVGLTGAAAKTAAALMIAAAALAVWRTDPTRVPVERAALWLVGTAFLVATPAQPWYAVLLVVLAVLAGCLEWIAVAIGPYVLYMALFRDLVAGVITFGPVEPVGSGVLALLAVPPLNDEHDHPRGEAEQAEDGKRDGERAVVAQQGRGRVQSQASA